MTAPLVVMDVGDVLIRTRPMAQYQALGKITRQPWRDVADLIEDSGIVAAFETGTAPVADVVQVIRKLLGRDDLTGPTIRGAWNTVMGEAEPTLVASARALSAAGRLILASNTNPWHWLVARTRLADSGVTAPAVLSFDVGHAKPALEFFATLGAADPRVNTPGTIYIDDRRDNVAAADRHGLTGWLHRDPNTTARRLGDLLT
jgi:FMN phosphatase YigB (HAD superfamily)